MSPNGILQIYASVSYKSKVRISLQSISARSICEAPTFLPSKAIERVKCGQDHLKDELIEVFDARMVQHAESIREICDRGGLGPKG